MLTIKYNVYIKRPILTNNNVYCLSIPELKFDSTDLPFSSVYTITHTGTPEFTIQIDKRTNTLSELKLKNNSTQMFQIYLSSAYMYSADIKMESLHVLSLYFDSRYWPTLWQLGASDYHVIINSRGYISEIQRVCDGFKVSFNTDGSITKVD